MVAQWGPGKGEVLRGPEPVTPEPGVEFEGRKVRHGTNSGWRQHQQDGTDPCDICRQAKAAYDYRRHDAPEEVIRNRLHAKAQNRANTALRQRHPEEYKALYEAAKTELFAEAGLEPRRPR